MNIKGKDFLTLPDYDKDTLNSLLDFAQKLKKETREEKFHHILENKIFVMIFTKPSLRTRVSFEVGIKQLGGSAVILKQDEINLGVRETIADTARVLTRYADGIIIRTFNHKDVKEFAFYSDVPVINALTDLCHPCQVLADLLTIKEKFNKLDGLKLAYIGDGNNMANSLLAGCSIMGMDVSIACPDGYEPDETYLQKCMKISQTSGSKIQITDEPFEAVKGANVVYTDVWASMGQEDEAEKRRKIFSGYQINEDFLKKAAYLRRLANPKSVKYQINEELLKTASRDVIVLHCLPAHRGEEISEKTLEKHADTIFEQAENRLHAQKAIMASII